MITFRCNEALFARMEALSLRYGIDRTSVLKLALHFYLNCRGYRRRSDK